MRQSQILLWIGAIVLLAGCQLLHTGQRSSPFEHKLVHDQVVLHSEVALDGEQRLLDDLAAQREWVTARLALPQTDVPIHVYLFSDDVAYYSFLDLRYPNFPARRAIFVETEEELSVYAHWGDHVAEDLRHEVSHGYLHAALPHLPLWLDEGLAEYFEVGVSNRGLNQTHIDLLLALYENGQWQPQMSRLELLEATADMQQVDYAEAWAWVHFLLESGDKQDVLLGYLAELRTGGTSTPFGSRVGKRLAGPELALVEHLQTLR